MKSQSRIAFFGGTFDPVHFGHVSLIITMQEKWQLDEVVISPVFCSPFKEDNPPTITGAHRLKMCELAFEGVPNVRISDREIKRGGPSFTIETIEKLHSQHKEKIFLILSEDVATHLTTWKDAEKLLKITFPVIADRKMGLFEKISPEFKKGFTKMPLNEISSTEVRTRIKKKLYCGHLIPYKVLDYIYQNHLY